MTPEALVQLIVGLSQPRDRNELSTKLKQSGEVFATARVAALLQCLNNLNPTEHSLGFTFFLYALGERNDAPAERFLFLASGFLQTCEVEQVKLCPEQFAGVCRMLKNSFITLGRPRQGIIPLQAAIRKLQPDKETLTPMHSDLFQLCLLSKCYGAALPFVDEDIYEVDPKATATTTTDVLLYGYYGGMVQTGRRAYGQALDMLLVTLTCPAAAASSIQLHAYKKFVLLQILEAGAPHGPAKSGPGGLRPVWAESGEKGIPLRPNLSKSMSSVVTRAVRTFAGPYDELAAAFNRNNLPALQAKYTQYASVFAQDGNAGLAKLVLSAVVKRRMQSLTQTYVTLSLNDIASEVGLASAAEAQAYILRLVASDEIHAEIDEGDGMVRFRDRPKLFDSVEASRQLDACIRNVIDINGRVTSVNDQISTDRRYIELLPLREDRSRLEGIMSYLHPGTGTEPR